MAEGIDLKTLLGTKSTISDFTDSALQSLIDSVNSVNVTVTGNTKKDIFDCAISLNDVLDFNLDFFNLESNTYPNYILLQKIRALRRLIQNINNTFIKMVKDLDCCTSDDMYNKLVVPIFKWLVEDENGLCGILLRMAKEINTIYIPLKNILCLFRPIPGNPTFGVGIDFLKHVYPVVEGLEKVANVLENGRFLDILIVPIKTFHDKLIACANGENVDLYDGSYIDFVTINGIITETVHAELNEALLDTLKELKGQTLSTNVKLPLPPEYKKVVMETPAPRFDNYNSNENFKIAMNRWNELYYLRKKESDRVYDREYSEYLLKMKEYKQSEFLKDMSLNTRTISNSSLAIDLNTDALKDTHRAVCGCIAEFAGMDGLFLPKNVVIRSESDLNGLRKHVLYRGISGSQYYTDTNKKKIKIIDNEEIAELRKQPVELDLETRILYSMTPDELMNRINMVTTLGDVIMLHNQFVEEKNVLYRDYVGKLNNYQAVEYNLKDKYKNDLKDANLDIAFLNTKILQGIDVEANTSKLNEALKRRNSIFEYPPREWISTPDKTLVKTNGVEYSYNSYNSITDELVSLKDKIDGYEMAIKRLHTTVEIVNTDPVECSCALICMIVKYIINAIMTIIKKLIMYLISYIAGATVNKELQWWMAFISAKVQCIINLMNMPDEIEKMRERFENELQYAKGTIRKLEQDSACYENAGHVVKEFSINEEVIPVDPDTFPDVPWNDSDFPYVTPVSVDDPFGVTYENVTFEETEWKNRTIPTTILNCDLDHKFKLNWIPTSPMWSVILNLNISQAQFENNGDLELTNEEETEEEKLINYYNDTIWKLLQSAQKQKDYNYRIEIAGIQYDINSDFAQLDPINKQLIYQNNFHNVNDIDRLWFTNIYSVNMILVFNRLLTSDLDSILNNYNDTIKQNLKDLTDDSVTLDNEFDTSNSKICSATNLQIVSFKPLFNDSTSILYPGEMTFVNDADPKYIFKPKLNFHQNNVPFKLVMSNASGTEFKVLLFIDIQVPNGFALTPVAYDKSVDPLYENGRYDYIEFDTIPNNADKIYKQSEIISRLKNYLISIGLISNPLPGTDLNNAKDDTIVKSGENEDNLIADEFSLSDFPTDNSDDVYNNLPEGSIKDQILKTQNKTEKNLELLEEADAIIKDLVSNIETKVKIMDSIPDGLDSTNNDVVKSLLTNKPQKVGIPILVLNEEKNIVLTIHDKKLKLININAGILNSEFKLETGQILLNPGENLLIEFTTNGFEYTIGWTNDRKMSEKVTSTSLNSIDLKPTYVGSMYINNIPVALMCGKLNDLIITTKNRPTEEWYNYSNTYRPAGTIGFYDFSLFDGYHVYSLPPKFEKKFAYEVDTLKSKLYESNDITQEEILKYIELGNYSALKDKVITIVGERPISVGGDFTWKNNAYYKNVSFGHLENFFCRDNLKGKPFTISFWLKEKNPEQYNKKRYNKMFIISDTHNGNFIWLEDGHLKIQLRNQPLYEEPVNLLFRKDIFQAENPEYVEKWFHHVFRYDIVNSTLYYTIECIDNVRNFDSNYADWVLNKRTVKIPLKMVPGRGKVVDFSLVTMLATFDTDIMNYKDIFSGEIAALAIWNEFLDNHRLETVYKYQKRIIQNEVM